MRISRIRLFGPRFRYVTEGAQARLRQRIAFLAAVASLPCYPCPLRAAAQPFAPRADDTQLKLWSARVISGDAEIPIVPQQLSLERYPLLAHRLRADYAGTSPSRA